MEEAAAEYEKLLELDPAVCEAPNRISRRLESSAIISAVCWRPGMLRGHSKSRQKRLQAQLNDKEARPESTSGLASSSRSANCTIYPSSVTGNLGNWTAPTLKLPIASTPLTESLSNSSRYDYLLRNKIVSTHQLQEALTIAKKSTRASNTSWWTGSRSTCGRWANRFRCFTAVVSAPLTRRCPFRSS